MKAASQNPLPCPECGYDLRSQLDATDDRKATCPECGRTWTHGEVVDDMVARLRGRLKRTWVLYLPALIWGTMGLVFTQPAARIPPVIGLVILLLFLLFGVLALFLVHWHRFRVLPFRMRVSQVVFEVLPWLVINVLFAMILGFGLVTLVEFVRARLA